MTATTAEIGIERSDANRQHRLADAAHQLRTRASKTDGARTLLYLGGVLLPMGFVLILLGWAGASHTANLYEQIPYSISGGMLGLAVVFAGGFCYFAYWLTQLVYAARRDAADTRVILERMEELFAGRAMASTAMAEPTTATTATTATTSTAARPRRQLRATEAGAAIYFATATGTMFHRADCPAVAGRDGAREVTGDEPGLTPCKICNPT